MAKRLYAHISHHVKQHTVRFYMVIMTLVVMVLMLCVVTGYGLYNSQVLEHQITSSTQSALAVYGDMLDANLQKSAAFINVFLSDNEYCYFPDEITDATDLHLKYVRLYNHLLHYAPQLSPCDGAFLLDSVNNRWSIIASQPVPIPLQDAVRHVVEQQSDSPTQLRWTMLQFEGRDYLLHTQQNKGIYAGLWIAADTLAQMARVDITPGTRLYIESASPTSVAQEESAHALVVRTPSQTQVFTMCAQIPRNEIYENVAVLQRILIAIIVVFVVLVAAQFALTNRILLVPLQGLTQVMRQIAGGDLAVRSSKKHANADFREVSATLNHMLDEIQQLKIHVYEEKLAKQEFQLDFLKLQINPHFFLNCLNIIHSLALAQRYDLIQTMASDLSQYFRYIFRTTDHLVNVEKELEHVENYLHIQEVRYPQRFTYRIRRDTPTQHVIIPPLMIQTFVENSIKYGFVDSRQEMLKIGIRIIEAPNCFSITVRDNGRGFTPDVLAKLQAGVSLEDESGNHIGIQNTLKRLRLLYQDAATVTFKNNDGAYVHIMLPKNTEIAATQLGLPIERTNG